MQEDMLCVGGGGVEGEEEQRGDGRGNGRGLVLGRK